jgi:predicted glycosyltransferase/nucleoside-diphosphate-sugar epimerase
MNHEENSGFALPSIRTSCGHPTHHAIRISLESGWNTVCLACWRSNRKTYRSLEHRHQPKDFGTRMAQRAQQNRQTTRAAGIRRCLITGAAGFIGSHLAERLLSDGYEVVGIDCLTDYYSSELKHRNLGKVIDHPNFQWVREDINETNLGKLLEGIDWVFHLAGQPGVRGSWGTGFDPYIRNNIEATQRLLEAVRTSQVKKLVYASSSSVYGRTAPPMSETNPTRPYSPYGVTKLTAEHLCMLYAENFALPITAVRYFTVFGPRQRPDMAFTRFLRDMVEDRELHIYGDGKQSRDFTYVTDAVAGTVLAAQHGIPGEVYNLGGGCPAALIDAIHAMERATGKPARLVHTPMKKGDVMDTLADTARARACLGYFPAVSLEEGIRRQALWIKEEIARTVAESSFALPAPNIARFPVSNPEREKLRVLLYSHDTFGLGHLRRNLAIADHLLSRQDPGFAVTLLTGSPVASSWPLPKGLVAKSLPPVVKVGAEQYAPRDTSESFEAVKARREEAILDVIRDFRPDIFLADHAPAGMKGELLRPLAFIREHLPETRTVIGLRDIVDSGETVQELWKQQGIYQLLDRFYDQVLVYGSRHLFDPVSEYNFPVSIADKTEFCGYVARRITGFPPHEIQGEEIPSDRPFVLVTAGGGGDGYPLMEGYLRAIESIGTDRLHSAIVPGPLMSPEERQALEHAAARRPDIQLIHTTELESLIWRADLVVSMSGYNTTAEIVAAKKPSILVPRSAPRAEQRLRAQMLSNLGLARMIAPEDELVPRLRELLEETLAGPSLHTADWKAVDLGGVHRVGEALSALFHERITPHTYAAFNLEEAVGAE